MGIMQLVKNTIENIRDFVSDNFPKSRNAIFLIGGASAMSPADVSKIKQLMRRIAEYADDNDVVIVDGGTNAGIMKMISTARSSITGEFPLIGVTPASKLLINRQTGETEAVLDIGHTHSMLIDGDNAEWGDESEALQSLADSIANGKNLLGILINGGQLSMREVELAVKNNRPMLVIDGTGRSANILAQEYSGYDTNNALAQSILAYVRKNNALFTVLHIDDVDGIIRHIDTVFK